MKILNNKFLAIVKMGLFILVTALPLVIKGQNKSNFDDSIKNILNDDYSNQNIEMLLGRANLNDSLISRIYFSASINFYKKGLLKEAKDNGLKALNTIKGKNYQKLITNYNNNLNIFYYELGNNDSSYYYLNDNYERLKISDDYSAFLNNLNALGLHFIKTKQFDLAEDKFNELLFKAEEKNNTEVIVNALIGLSNVKKELGDLVAAERNLKEVLALDNKNVVALNKLGILYKEQKDYKNAILYYQKAYDMTVGKNAFREAALLNNLGNIYLLQENDKEALEYFQKAEKVAKQANSSEFLKVSYKGQSDSYESQKKYNEALIFLRKHNQINDSLVALNSKKSIEQLQESILVKEKNSQLEILKNQKIISEQENKFKSTIIIAAVLILLLAITFLIYFINSNKVLKNTQAMLVESNIVKDRLFAAISHDLKNKISSLENIGDLIVTLYNKKQEEKAIKLANELDQETLSLNQLLNNLLLWSIKQFAGVKKQKNTFNLKPLVESIRIANEKKIKLKNITFSNHIDENSDIESNENAVLFILRNLIENAIKFSPISGEINIKLLEDNSHKKLMIKDNGVGMSENQLKKLFLPEHKVFSKGTAGEKGSGLGIKLCYDFAKKNDIEIIVESVLNKGTVFTLFFKK